MSRRVVIINGSGGVGKDTFIEFCKEYAQTKNLDVLHFSTITPIVEALKSLDYEGGKTEADRLFLSEVWDSWYKYNQGPTKRVATKVLESKEDCIVFVVIRQIEAIPDLVKSLSATTLLLSNSRVDTPSNHADSEVDRIPYDTYIDNEGTTEELKVSASKFIDELLAGEITRHTEIREER